jgi:hypothetical protein
MTVRTNDIALCDLVEQRLPAASAKARGDAELLVGEMIELQDEWIVLATVDARSLTEQSDQIVGTVGCELLFAANRSCDVTVSILRVVLAHVLGSAFAAVADASTTPSTRGKLGSRFQLATAGAAA